MGTRGLRVNALYCSLKVSEFELQSCYYAHFHTHTLGKCMVPLIIQSISQIEPGVGPRGVMIKAMDGGIIVSEFGRQSRYYVHFRANILGNGMNPLILPGMG